MSRHYRFRCSVHFRSYVNIIEAKVVQDIASSLGVTISAAVLLTAVTITACLIARFIFNSEKTSSNVRYN